MRSRAFVAVACLFLIGPLMLSLIDACSPTVIPSWLGSEEALYIEGNKSQSESIREALSVEAFLAKDLQDALEGELGQNIPLKAAALLGNARIQCASISMSNMIFDYPCYPTYYGSNYVFDPENSSINKVACPDNLFTALGLNAFASGLQRVAQEYENIRFLVCVATESEYASCNPSGTG